jgi:hypothetical protein
MYIIRGADQNEYGPVSADIVRQWIAERRADSRTLIRSEDSPEWKPLDAWPEFQPASTQSFGPPRAPSKNQGLAVASLILGIVAMLCLGPFAGIPALILGIVALNRTRRQPDLYAGNGFAIAGITLGAVSFLSLFILAGMFLPALAKAREKAQSIRCVNNLKQIGVATMIYASDHADTFPADLTQLDQMGFEPQTLWCPADTAKSPANRWSDLSPENISYTWQGAGFRESRLYPNFILSHCPIHGHVLQADGAVISTSSKR